MTEPNPPIDLDEIRNSALLVGLICHCDNPKCTEERTWARETLIRLADELQDIQDGNRIILEEKCASDEVHCGCVPTLRGEIERLKGRIGDYQDASSQKSEIICGQDDENARLRAALEKIERGGPWDSKSIARAALEVKNEKA